MEQLLTPEKKYYTLTSTPWYFGAYLNQARHNLAIVLNDLSMKLGGEAVTDDANLKSTKAIHILRDRNAKPDDVQKAMDYYEKKLPFLYAMHYKYHVEEEVSETHTTNLSASPEGYAAILELLIEMLNNARNHYSHYAAGVELSAPEGLFYLLNDAFDVNIRIVKRRFGLEEKDVEHLRRFIPNRDKNITAKNGNKLKVVPNPAFKYWFNGKDSKATFSEYGLAFFICLFLNPGEAYLFLKKISGLKLGNTASQKASLDAYCVNNLHLPIERLESDNSAQALFLDMCNEITKAPKELYETLHPDKQKLFITKQADSEEEADMPEDEEPGLETKMIRKNNRFTFFAQRFLDVTNAFKSLRFAVDLGNFHFSIYPKVIAGIEETRHLTKHLIGYGKLEDFSLDKRQEHYAKKYFTIEQKNLETPAQYIPETFPHYHVENNIIAISLEEGSAFWPTLDTEATNGQKSYPYRYLKSKEKKPYAYLSTYEMPALLLYELVQDKTSAQEIIVQHIKKVRQFFTDIKNGKVQPVSNSLMNKPAVSEINKRSNEEYNQRFVAMLDVLHQYHLKPEYIPEKLVNYLLGIAPKGVEYTNEKATQRLNAMIEEATERIERMALREQSEIKPGKQAFRKIKVGKLADILAEDMMLMQPPVKAADGSYIPSSKANSTAFRVLQSHLAYFGANKDKLPGIFKACNLLAGDNPHPFLHKIAIANQLGIIEFYKEYFNEKVQYLNRCRKEKKYTEYHFLKIKNARQDIGQLVEALLNTHSQTGYSAFNLPRGLFHQAIMNYFKEYGSPVMKEYVTTYATNSNSVHLINYYFEHEHKDASPNFYTWGRQYDLFKTPFTKNGNNDYYSIDERMQQFPGIKQIVKQNEQQKDQLKAAAEKDKNEIGTEIRRYRGIHEMINFLVTKYQKKYPSMIELKHTRFKEYEVPRKIIGKAYSMIDDQISDIEKRGKAYHFFIANEQYLRLAEAQDKLIFLCIKKMLANSGNQLQLLNGDETSIQDNNTFLLKNIAAPNDAAGKKSILNCKPAKGISFSYPFYAISEKGDFIKENGRKIQQGEVEIVDRHLKIKNNGNFRKLMKDRRLNNLCFYFMPDREGKILFNRNVLENELKEYERQRLIVLEKVAAFEKVLYKKHQEKAVDLFYRNGVQEHKRYLAFYFETYESDGQAKQEVLNAIRNGFLHNQYPNIKDEKFNISPEVWENKNAAYIPSASGSTKGYELIDQIAAIAIDWYSLMIATINTSGI